MRCEWYTRHCDQMINPIKMGRCDTVSYSSRRQSSAYGLRERCRPFAICYIQWMLLRAVMISLCISHYILPERGLLTMRSSSYGHTITPVVSDRWCCCWRTKSLEVADLVQTNVTFYELGKLNGITRIHQLSARIEKRGRNWRTRFTSICNIRKWGLRALILSSSTFIFTIDRATVVSAAVITQPFPRQC